MKKEAVSLLVIVCFLTLAFSQSGAQNTYKVTFSRIGPDKKVETFEKTIECTQKSSLSAQILEECQVLFETDEEFKQLADSGTGLYMIISNGDGLHFALPPSSNRYSRIAEMYFALIPCILYCHYNQGGLTDIKSWTSGENITLEGAHKLMCVGFMGFLGWSSAFTIRETGFVGITPYLWYDAS